MAVASVTVGGEAVDTGLYGFTPSGLSPQESPLRAAFSSPARISRGNRADGEGGLSRREVSEPIRQWMLV